MDERKGICLAGSETRQRQKAISFRCDDAEHEIIKAMADFAGVKPATFCRSQVLNKPLPRAARHPAVNQKEVARLIGQMGALQISLENICAATDGKAILTDIQRDLSDIRNAAFQALGRKP